MRYFLLLMLGLAGCADRNGKPESCDFEQSFRGVYLLEVDRRTGDCSLRQENLVRVNGDIIEANEDLDVAEIEDEQFSDSGCTLSYEAHYLDSSVALVITQQDHRGDLYTGLLTLRRRLTNSCSGSYDLVYTRQD